VVVGGFGISDVLNDTWIYDIDINEWREACCSARLDSHAPTAPSNQIHDGDLAEW
jgi:hypothetical protein